MNRKASVSFDKNRTVHCSFEGCNSDNRYASISFFSFPNPCMRVKSGLVKSNQRHIVHCPTCQRCQKWILLCKKKELSTLSDINKNNYICSLHFVERKPSEQFPDPLPADEVLRIRRSKRDKGKKKISELVVIDPMVPIKQLVLNGHVSKLMKTSKTQTAKQDSMIIQLEETPKHPEADTNNDFDPLDLNNLLLSTTTILKGMCKELQMSALMNNNVNHEKQNKQQKNLPEVDNDNFLQVFIDKDSADDATSLTKATEDLEQMLTEVQQTAFVAEKETQNTYQMVSTSTQTNDLTVEKENKKLKLEIAALKSRLILLENQLNTREQVPKLLFIRN